MIYGFFPSLGVPELLLIFGIVIVIFGAGKLPALGKALGQSIREFKGSVNEGSPEPARKEDK